MNIEELRDCCLSFAGVEEKMPFTHLKQECDRATLIFAVGGRWFCFVNADRGDFCTLKCDPDLAVELRERYAGISAGYHMNKRHWISVRLSSDVPDRLLRDLLRQAYGAVVRRPNT